MVDSCQPVGFDQNLLNNFRCGSLPVAVKPSISITHTVTFLWLPELLDTRSQRHSSCLHVNDIAWHRFRSMPMKHILALCRWHLLWCGWHSIQLDVDGPAFIFTCRWHKFGFCIDNATFNSTSISFPGPLPTKEFICRCRYSLFPSQFNGTASSSIMPMTQLFGLSSTTLLLAQCQWHRFLFDLDGMQLIATLQMKSRWESNINVWLRFM